MVLTTSAYCAACLVYLTDCKVLLLQCI